MEVAVLSLPKGSESNQTNPESLAHCDRESLTDPMSSRCHLIVTVRNA